MTAATYDITIEQGATFTLNVTWKDSNSLPINLTGYTARMQVRHTHKSATKLLDLTTTSGNIILGGVLGTIAVTATDDLTDNLDVRAGVYDLELIDGSQSVTRLIEGMVTITPEVTRP